MKKIFLIVFLFVSTISFSQTELCGEASMDSCISVNIFSGQTILAVKQIMLDMSHSFIYNCADSAGGGGDTAYKPNYYAIFTNDGKITYMYLYKIGLANKMTANTYLSGPDTNYALKFSTGGDTLSLGRPSGTRVAISKDSAVLVAKGVVNKSYIAFDSSQGLIKTINYLYIESSIPTAGGSDSLLCRNASTGELTAISQASVGATYYGRLPIVIRNDSVFLIQKQIDSTGTLVAGETGAGFTIQLGVSTITGTLSSVNGGMGINTSSATGVPTVSTGSWTINTELPSSLGGTGVNNGSNTMTWASSLNFGSSAKGYAYNHGNGIFTYDTTRAGGGTITGSGVSGQITFWNGTSSIAGSANHTFSDGVYDQMRSISNTGVHGFINIESQNGTSPAKSFWIKSRNGHAVQTGDSSYYLSFHDSITSNVAIGHILGMTKKISSTSAAADMEFATSSIGSGKVTAVVIDTAQNAIFKNKVKAAYLNITDSLANARLSDTLGGGGPTPKLMTQTQAYHGWDSVKIGTGAGGSGIINGNNAHEENDSISTSSTAFTLAFSNIPNMGFVWCQYYKTTASNSVITFPIGCLISQSGAYSSISSLAVTFASGSTGSFTIQIKRRLGQYDVFITQNK